MASCQRHQVPPNHAMFALPPAEISQVHVVPEREVLRGATLASWVKKVQWEGLLLRDYWRNTGPNIF